MTSKVPLTDRRADERTTVEVEGKTGNLKGERKLSKKRGGQTLDWNELPNYARRLGCDVNKSYETWGLRFTLCGSNQKGTTFSDPNGC